MKSPNNNEINIGINTPQTQLGLYALFSNSRSRAFIEATVITDDYANRQRTLK